LTWNSAGWRLQPLSLQYPALCRMRFPIARLVYQSAFSARRLAVQKHRSLLEERFSRFKTLSQAFVHF